MRWTLNGKVFSDIDLLFKRAAGHNDTTNEKNVEEYLAIMAN